LPISRQISDQHLDKASIVRLAKTGKTTIILRSAKLAFDFEILICFY
jgi:hypothetical protein